MVEELGKVQGKAVRLYNIAFFTNIYMKFVTFFLSAVFLSATFSY